VPYDASSDHRDQCREPPFAKLASSVRAADGRCQGVGDAGREYGERRGQSPDVRLHDERRDENRRREQCRMPRSDCRTEHNEQFERQNDDPRSPRIAEVFRAEAEDLPRDQRAGDERSKAAGASIDDTGDRREACRVEEPYGDPDAARGVARERVERSDQIEEKRARVVPVKARIRAEQVKRLRGVKDLQFEHGLIGELHEIRRALGEQRRQRGARRQRRRDREHHDRGVPSGAASERCHPEEVILRRRPPPGARWRTGWPRTLAQ
jgi:hypothetical protein